MIRALRRGWERWLALCVPATPDKVSLEAREQQRKRIMLCTITSVSIPVLAVYSIADFFVGWQQVALDWLAIALLLAVLWLVHRRQLVSASFLFFSDCIIVCDLGNLVISYPERAALVWNWLPLLLPTAVGGLLLPVWGPAILGAACFASFLACMIMRQSYFTYFNGEEFFSFLLYGSLLLIGLSIISAVHAHTVARALREADRSFELDKAHHELELAYKQVELLATNDPLTGLYNRRAFTDRLRQTLAANDQHSFIFADLDYFKRINDQWGHQTGDGVLAHLAGILKTTLAAESELARNIPTDLARSVAGRFGGEEFVILLPGVAKPTAIQIAEYLCRAVTRAPYNNGTGEVALTVSLGVATYPDDAATADALISAADAAMYQAKHSGRNRYCAFTRDLAA